VGTLNGAYEADAAATARISPLMCHMPRVLT